MGLYHIISDFMLRNAGAGGVGGPDGHERDWFSLSRAEQLKHIKEISAKVNHIKVTSARFKKLWKLVQQKANVLHGSPGLGSEPPPQRTPLQEFVLQSSSSFSESERIAFDGVDTLVDDEEDPESDGESIESSDGDGFESSGASDSETPTSHSEVSKKLVSIEASLGRIVDLLERQANDSLTMLQEVRAERQLDREERERDRVESRRDRQDRAREREERRLEREERRKYRLEREVDRKARQEDRLERKRER